MEYGYSCMAYEIPAGIGVKMADPSREVYVWVGDGTYLMNPTEIVTAIQEGIKLTIIIVNNLGFGSIGGLSKSIGSEGFGTYFKERDLETDTLTGHPLSVNFAQNAASLGAKVFETDTITGFKEALQKAHSEKQTCVIVVRTDRDERVPGYESWWDVAVAETSQMETVQKAREGYEKKRKEEKYFF
jgi:3D-(3,5/4)-trihydroxycyclohexane-1,2-dione acylhydrolase (decyclizing)